MAPKEISRRDFLKFAALSLGALAFNKFNADKLQTHNLSDLTSEADKNLFSLPEFLADKTQEISGKFIPSATMPVMIFPLKNDFSYAHTNKVNVFEIPSGMNLSYRNLYYFRNSGETDTKKQIMRTTILPDTMGTANLAVALLDRGYFNTFGRYIEMTPKAQGINSDLTEVLGEMSYIVGDGIVYPNKILNLINAFSNALDYQAKNGPFKAGEVYSYIDLIDLRNRGNYVQGYTSSLDKVTAGGICAGATLVSNAFFRTAETLGIPYEQTYLQPKYSHPSLYQLGPFGPDTFITDTTVQIGSNGITFDYKFIPPVDCYISPSVVLIPNGINFDQTDSQGLYVVTENGSFLRSDVQMVLNIAVTKDKPTQTSADLKEIWQNYIDYRNSNHQSSPVVMSRGCQYYGQLTWEDNSEIKNIVSPIYPEENRIAFETELANDPYYVDMITVMQILNSVDETSARDVAGYLRASDWYQNKLVNGQLTPRMESAINQLSYTKVPGQPVQCIGWASFLAGMPYSTAPADIGSVAIKGPNELIPTTVLTAPYRQTAPSPTGGYIIANRDMKIDDFHTGDLFVMRNTFIGHVGVIMGKKLYHGKYILLVTEANRQNDGRIAVYTVDEYNLNAKLGMPPQKKIIIRKY